MSGLLVDDMTYRTLFHDISWMSYNLSRAIKSKSAAEILTAGGPMDKKKVLTNEFWLLLEIDVALEGTLDSRDLFTSLFFLRNFDALGCYMQLHTASSMKLQSDRNILISSLCNSDYRQSKSSRSYFTLRSTGPL